MRTLAVVALGLVGLVMACSSASSNTPPQGAAGQSATATIGPAGGSVHIDGVGTVTFPAGALPELTTVRLETTADAATAALYDETSVIFELGKRAAYEIRINTGGVQPTLPLQLALAMPQELGVLAVALGQVLEASEEDTYDQFELLDANAPEGNAGGVGLGVVATTLPAEWISNGRRADRTFEGVVTLAQTVDLTLPPGVGFPGKQSVHPLAGGPASGACPVKKFGPPIKAETKETSPFNLQRSVVVNGKTYVGHFGVDLRAASGTTLISVGKGKVLESYTSTTFGESVVLQIEGVGAVRYAHLQSRAVKKGDAVTCGQVIGVSDNTGLTQHAHLHFELTPKGNYNNNTNKIDPLPCIDPNGCPACPLNVEYIGTSTYTLHQAYDASTNTSDEDITVKATGVVLSPDPQAGEILRPTAGTITYSRVETLHSDPPLPCTIVVTSTGSGKVVAGDPMAGALTCLPPVLPTDPPGTDAYYTTTLPMATRFTITHTGTCDYQGSTEEGGAGWLTIPSIYSGSGYKIPMDPQTLAGTFSQKTGPGGGATETWQWSFSTNTK